MRWWGAVLSLLCLVAVAHAEPTADQVLTDAGLSAADKQSGEISGAGSRSAVTISPLVRQALEARVEDVPEPVAEQIRAEHGEHEDHAGEEGDPPGRVQEDAPLR